MKWIKRVVILLVLVVVVVAGIAVVAGLDLWYPYHYKAGIPPGQLFVLASKDPTLESFAEDEAVLAYLPTT